MAERSDRTGREAGGGSLGRSLSLRLFLWLFGIVIVAFAGYAFLSMRAAAAHWQESVERCAQRCSEVIQHATHYGMLLNRKDDVHKTIQTIARTPGVSGVRIYDKNGVIIFSADDGEIGRRVDLQAEACIVCHEDVTPMVSVPTEERTRVYREGEHRVLGLINPIENQPECSRAPCHAHPPEQTVLGVLDVKLSLAEADERIAAARSFAITVAVLIALLLGIVSLVFIDRVVRRPVKRLIAGTERVARGELDVQLGVESHDEIGHLAEAFNRMTGDLRQARREITDWSEKLERKVVEKTEELGRTQRQVVHMEKMASLGKLAATVAHELNNPLAGILNYSRLAQRTLAEDDVPAEIRDEITRYLSVIQKESSRSGDVVRNLLLFARQSGVEFALHDINEVVDRALTLVRHHLEMAGVRSRFRRLHRDSRIVCDANQLQQALVALLVNAAEAMADGGALTVEIEDRGAEVRVSVTDTGAGIAPDVLPHIFEPFFSTKDGANGVGLGLAVVYGIVQRHQGEISVESALREGTTFRIDLPRRPRPQGNTRDRQSSSGAMAPHPAAATGDRS